jgi:hypothetical protein
VLGDLILADGGADIGGRHVDVLLVELVVVCHNVCRLRHDEWGATGQ